MPRCQNQQRTRETRAHLLVRSQHDGLFARVSARCNPHRSIRKGWPSPQVLARQLQGWINLQIELQIAQRMNPRRQRTELSKACCVCRILAGNDVQLAQHARGKRTQIRIATR